MDVLTVLPCPVSTLPANPGLLARYLPPIPSGIAAHFLSGHVNPAAWVLDPFGASPRLVVEMARLGMRILTSVNNPIVRFLVELEAASHPKSEFQAALAELAASRKGQERMETHLQSLYLAECYKCGLSLPAQAFIWERGGREPAARILTCPSCHEHSESETTPADRQRAAQIEATSALHRARALERVTSRGDPDREHVQEAMNYYLPRAVYAIITIINRMDGLLLSPVRRHCLEALVLAACDEASTLWPHPDERPRPRQLTIPPRFRENNIWQALEHAVETCSVGAVPVPFTIWPDLPSDGGGICLFEGPLRDLAPRLKDIPIQSVLTALPRPNQAFWTLSALWAGWLWGHAAVAPFKMTLHHLRYDWSWHTTALLATLRSLAPHLTLNAPLFAILAEPEPGFLSAAMLAADSASFNLTGIGIRTRDDPAYLVWHRRAFTHLSTSLPGPDQTVDAKESGSERRPPAVEPSALEKLRAALRDYLSQRGEPVPYLHLHAAGLAALVDAQFLKPGGDAPAQVQASIQQTLASSAFVHYGMGASPENGFWGLPVSENSADSLPDEVERDLVAFIQKNPDSTFAELETALYSRLRGLLTPSLALIRAVLDSYAFLLQKVPGEMEGRFRLRPEDDPLARRCDLEQTRLMLASLGPKLNFVVEWDEDQGRLTWLEHSQPVYTCHLLASAAVSRLLRLSASQPGGTQLLVLPGGRSGLLAYKLERDPALKQIWDEGGWRVLKYRQLRRLAGLSGLTRQKWEEQLILDPLTPPEQMRLF